MTYTKREVDHVLRQLRPHAPLWVKVIRSYIRRLEKQAKPKHNVKEGEPA